MIGLKQQKEVIFIVCVIFMCSSLHEYKEINFLTQQVIKKFDLSNSSIMVEELLIHFWLFDYPLCRLILII